jgi:hypothetical protein
MRVARNICPCGVELNGGNIPRAARNIRLPGCKLNGRAAAHGRKLNDLGGGAPRAMSTALGMIRALANPATAQPGGSSPDLFRQWEDEMERVNKTNS